VSDPRAPWGDIDLFDQLLRGRRYPAANVNELARSPEVWSAGPGPSARLFDHLATVPTAV